MQLSCSINKQKMPVRPNKIQRSYKPAAVAFARPRDLSWFYNARKWRKTAKAFKELNPFCYECMSEDRAGLPEVTDHIKGLGFLLDNNLNAYDYKELQNLCHQHHNSKSGKESHKNKFK